jgi:hypothetical protein
LAACWITSLSVFHRRCVLGVPFVGSVCGCVVSYVGLSLGVVVCSWLFRFSPGFP